MCLFVPLFMCFCVFTYVSVFGFVSVLECVWLSVFVCVIGVIVCVSVFVFVFGVCLCMYVGACVCL